MTDYCRVEIPILSVKSIREAEPGMELEEAAFNRDGQVIAEEGEVLTEERIEKFKRLNVRKVVTMSTETQWLPEDEVQSLDRDLEVKERKEFSEATGEIVESLRENHTVENLRKTALHLRRQAHHAGDQEGVEYLDEVIEQTYQLEEEIQDLQQRLEEVEDEDAREELLDALEGKIRQLDEAMLDLSAPESLVRETIDAVQEKDQIRFSLSDFVMKNPDFLEEGVTEVNVDDFHEVDEHSSSWAESLKHIGAGNLEDGIDSLINSAKTSDSAGESLVMELEQLKEEFRAEKEIKNQLLTELEQFDLSDEDYGVVKGVLEGQVSLRKSELFDLPIPNDFARKSYEFMQDQLDYRHRLWERADDVSDGELSELVDKSKFIDNSLQTEPSSESKSSPADGGDDPQPETVDSLSVELPDEAVEETVKTIRKQGVDEGMDQFIDTLEKTGDVSEEDLQQLERAQAALREVDGEKDAIKKQVEERIGDGDLQEEILEVLRGDADFNPEEFMKLDAPPGLLEQVADHLLEEMNARREVWKRLDEATGDSAEVGGAIQSNKNKIDSELDRTVNAISGTTQSGSDSVDREEEETDGEDSLRKLVQTLEPYELASRLEGLSVSTIKNAQQLLDPPSDLTAEQRQLCEPLIDEAHQIFYRRELNDDSLEQVAFSLADDLADSNQPLKILLDPPAGDRYLLSHGINTCLVSLRLAEYFDLDSSDLLDLAAASLSLDFGMVEIPMGLWVKDDDLSKRADQEVKKHPHFSSEIVDGALNGDDVIADLVQQHHERSDGSGYPEGLSQGEQHDLSPLLSVADAYVAMLEERPYRSGMQPDQALKALLSERGSYDSETVKAIIEKIGIYPDGCVVLLSDKRLGLVKSQNPDSPTNPTVLIITDTDRNRLDSPVPEDLSESGISIEKIVKR